MMEHLAKVTFGLTHKCLANELQEGNFPYCLNIAKFG